MLFEVSSPGQQLDKHNLLSTPTQLITSSGSAGFQRAFFGLGYNRVFDPTLETIEDTLMIQGMQYGHLPIMLRLHLDSSHLNPSTLDERFPDHNQLALNFAAGDHLLLRERALNYIAGSGFEGGESEGQPVPEPYVWAGKVGYQESNYPFYTDWVQSFCESTAFFQSAPDLPIFFGQSNVHTHLTAEYQEQTRYDNWPQYWPFYSLSYFLLLRQLYYFEPILEGDATVPEEFIDQEMTEERFAELRDEYRTELLSTADLKAPNAIRLYRRWISKYGIDPEKFPRFFWNVGGTSVQEETPLSLRILHAKWIKDGIRHPEYTPSFLINEKYTTTLFANNFWKFTPFKEPYTQNNAGMYDDANTYVPNTVKKLVVRPYLGRELWDANSVAFENLNRHFGVTPDVNTREKPKYVNTPNFDFKYAIPLYPGVGIQDPDTEEWSNDLSEESPSFIHAVQ